ncbi:unnamed protein product [Didymodactylos carnosus]|uniref:Ubiquitin-like domain-containing protein n=1 Tax=Didymodactylos carnosus TaxID=1234261 RepID=A0A8S2EXI4_9BILA|nr:unnamed protein product [Didymodactylos carnosus]CAF4072356.1 unnamed protein product [Didymodactylos carnosus]
MQGPVSAGSIKILRKGPSCDVLGTLIICEYCNCAKCTFCNEKHLSDIRTATKTALNLLENTDQEKLKESIQSAYKHVRNEICQQFQNIRQQFDSLLLHKQREILNKLEQNEHTQLQQVQQDITPLETTKFGLSRQINTLDTKSELELLTLLNTSRDLQKKLEQKLINHQAKANQVEISLKFDQDLLVHLNHLCNNFQLNITDGASSPSTSDLSSSAEELRHSLQRISSDNSKIFTLRTFLGREFKVKGYLTDSLSKLKQTLGKQEGIDPVRVTLSKSGNFFEELDDNKLLKDYNCDETTVLMVCMKN